MKKPLLLLLIPILAALIWGFITPNGIRAAIANNAWSLAFMQQYFGLHNDPLDAPPTSHADSGLLLARKSLKEGNLNRAAEFLQPLVKRRDPLALNAYAEVLFSQGEYAAASHLWEYVGNAIALEQKSNQLYALGKYDAVIQAFQSLYAIDAEKYTSSLAVALNNFDQPDVAKTLLLDSIHHYPGSDNLSSWWRYLGNFHSQQQELPEAEVSYHLAVKIKPNNLKAWKELGFLYLDQMQDNEQAIACFERVLQLEPHQIYNHLLLAKIYEQSGYFDKALYAYQQALSIDPTNIEAKQGEARISQQH